MTRKFIVFAVDFDENSGGAIALHLLCDLLNRAGQRALLWPSHQPLRTYARFDTPIATQADLPGAVVVYPEIIDGNPLGAQHVVRWLLHKPGFHTGRIEYGPLDRYFFYQKAFDDPRLNPDGDNHLRTIYLRDDVYRTVNFGTRKGNCYILRKGKGRKLVHELSNSILVDGMSHAETAEVFNRVETCISYDTYTMYSQYAALCGCFSVVVPEEGVSKEQWRPDPRDRYGLAWGFDDIGNTVRTRALLLPRLKEQALTANENVKAFVAKCANYFPE